MFYHYRSELISHPAPFACPHEFVRNGLPAARFARTIGSGASGRLAGCSAVGPFGRSAGHIRARPKCERECCRLMNLAPAIPSAHSTSLHIPRRKGASIAAAAERRSLFYYHFRRRGPVLAANRPAGRPNERTNERQRDHFQSAASFVRAGRKSATAASAAARALIGRQAALEAAAAGGGAPKAARAPDGRRPESGRVNISAKVGVSMKWRRPRWKTFEKLPARLSPVRCANFAPPPVVLCLSIFRTASGPNRALARPAASGTC